MSAALGTLRFSSPLAQRAQQQGWIKWAIAVTVSLGAVLEVIDVSIVNVALTPMQGNLGATLSEIGWGDYRLWDRECGHHPADGVAGRILRTQGPTSSFRWSVFHAGFGVVAGMATSLPMLIISRVLQGLAGREHAGEGAVDSGSRPFPRKSRGAGAGGLRAWGDRGGRRLARRWAVYLTDMLKLAVDFLHQYPVRHFLRPSWR